MNRRFLGRHESRAHVDAVGAEGEGGHQATGVGHTAGSHKRDLELIGGSRQQDHVRDIILAGMATALEAVHAHRITPDPLGLQSMPD